MKKKYIIILLCIVLCVSIIASAQSNTMIEAMLYDVDIFFDGKKIEFQSPVVMIDNQTYIPLREAAEKLNIKVEWDGAARRIILMDNLVELNNIFVKLFGFDLPKSAEIKNFDCYNEFEDQILVAKIIFDKDDLSYIQGGLGKKLTMSVDSGSKITDETSFLSYYSNKYPWWDLTESYKIRYCYHGVESSMSFWSLIHIWGFITEDSDNQFCLYLSRNLIG